MSKNQDQQRTSRKSAAETQVLKLIAEMPDRSGRLLKSPAGYQVQHYIAGELHVSQVDEAYARLWLLAVFLPAEALPLFSKRVGTVPAVKGGVVEFAKRLAITEREVLKRAACRMIEFITRTPENISILESPAESVS